MAAVLLCTQVAKVAVITWPAAGKRCTWTVVVAAAVVAAGREPDPAGAHERKVADTALLVKKVVAKD